MSNLVCLLTKFKLNLLTINEAEGQIKELFDNMYKDKIEQVKNETYQEYLDQNSDLDSMGWGDHWLED